MDWTFLACDQALHLEESREVTQETRAKGDWDAMARCFAIRFARHNRRAYWEARTLQQKKRRDLGA